MNAIKIFGLPRSCTNFTTILLRDNFRCKILDNFPCWKHGYNTYVGRKINSDEVVANDLKFIICTKHPIDWLWSLFCFENETKRKQKRSSFDFLTKNTWHYNKEIKLNPIEAFNKLNEHWLTMYPNPEITLQFKFEDLNKDFEKELLKIENNFNFKRKQKKFRNLENKVKPGGKISDDKFEKRQHEWTEEDLGIIHKNLDHSVVELCGYKI